MTGDKDGPFHRRKPAQALDEPSGEGAVSTRPESSRPDRSSGADAGAVDTRVEDLGNGRVRLSVELPWSLALRVLDLLRDSAAPQRH